MPRHARRSRQGHGASGVPSLPPCPASYNSASMVIALDVGTSSARAALYDARGRAVEGRFHQVPYEPATTRDGGVEHDPRVLLDAATTCLDAVARAARHDDVQAVGVTTFWHGLLGFDAEHRPVTPVFTWADSRSASD